ncbi:MAG: CaiB/BaiF CoA transferase family protein [Dehalococcoidia bacterium]
MPMPLEGVRILDLSVFQQGTHASAMLADLGADVIKIESYDNPDPGRGSGGDPGANGIRPYFAILNRNKRGIALDLKNPVGRETFLKLCETADVFHSNMRLGVLERMNLTYDVVKARNPRIIFSQATGWGHRGPDAEAHLGSVDGLAQARGGLLSINGTKESGPHNVPLSLADQIGGMISAFGMMVALWEREQSGVGQEVNTSLYGSQLALQNFNITNAMWNQKNPELRGKDEARPHWGTYTCQDGGLLMVAGTTPDRWWKEFCATVGAPECGEGTYSKNQVDTAWCVKTRAALGACFATKTRDEWMSILSPKFLVQPVRTYLEIAEDPQAWANEYLTHVPHGEDRLPVVGLPVHMSRTPGSVRHLAPEVGQHTEEVLLEAGWSWEEIAAMREAGAFGKG